MEQKTNSFALGETHSLLSSMLFQIRPRKTARVTVVRPELNPTTLILILTPRVRDLFTSREL